MKTTMKKRLVSTLLAFAMVLSLLPAGLIPEVFALKFGNESDHGSGTLTIGSDGTFTAIYTGAIGSTGLGDQYFALVPDIGTVEVDGNATVSEFVKAKVINAGSLGTFSAEGSRTGFKGQVESSTMGAVKAGACLFIPMEQAIPIDQPNGKVTITQNTCGIGSLGSLGYNTVLATLPDEFYIPKRDGSAGHEKVQKADLTGIPYVAVLFSGADPATLNIAKATWSAENPAKLIVSNDIAVHGGTSRVGVPAFNQLFAAQAVTLTNIGGENAIISGVTFSTPSNTAVGRVNQWGLFYNAADPDSAEIPADLTTLTLITADNNVTVGTTPETKNIVVYMLRLNRTSVATSGNVTPPTFSDGSISVAYDSAGTSSASPFSPASIAWSYSAGGYTGETIELTVNQYETGYTPATVTLPHSGTGTATFVDAYFSDADSNAEITISAGGTTIGTVGAANVDGARATLSGSTTGDLTLSLRAADVSVPDSYTGRKNLYIQYQEDGGAVRTVQVRVKVTVEPVNRAANVTVYHNSPSSVWTTTTKVISLESAGTHPDGIGGTYTPTGSSHAASSSSNGVFSFNNLPNGTYDIVEIDGSTKIYTGETITITNAEGTGKVEYYDFAAAANTGGSLTSGTTPNGTYVKNKPLTVGQTPDSGYRFTGWTGTGLSSGNPPATLTTEIDITANFDPNVVTVNMLLNNAADTRGKYVRLYNTTTNSYFGTAAVQADTTTGKAVFTAVPNGTYAIHVGDTAATQTATGLSLTVKNNDPSTTLRYYEVKLATPINNGTVTATYNSGTAVTTAGATVATILSNTGASNPKDIAVTATPYANHEANWTDSPDAAGAFAMDSGSVRNGTWTLTDNYSGAGPIILDPGFARTGVGANITVNLDTVGTDNLTVSISTNTNGTGTGAKTGTTAGGGKVRFDGLTAETTYYVTVTTSGYSGVYSFTTPANADAAETLDYYTVTAADGTGSLNARVTGATHVLTGTTTTVASAADYAHGYGQTGSWTLTAGAAGSASTISSSNVGASSTITVNGTVTATANYTANSITVNIYKNGVLDTATDRTVSLRKSDGTIFKSTTVTGGVATTPVDASKSTGTAGTVTFTPVDSTTTTSDETYYIYVGNEATGHTVTCAPGFTTTKSLYYYDVTYADVSDVSNYGHYTSGRPSPATVEVLAGGTKNSVDLPAVTPANANYGPAGWTMAPPTTGYTADPGSFLNSAGGTVTGSGALDSGTVDAVKWQINANYQEDLTGLTPKGILLTPVFATNGNYSATIKVNLNGSAVPDSNPATVTLKSTSGGATKSAQTSGGSVSFDGLKGTYTITVTDGSGANIRTYHGDLPQISGAGTTELNFFTFMAAVTSVTTGGANQGIVTRGTDDGVYYAGTTVAATGSPNPGYHFVSWTGTDGGGTVNSNSAAYSKGITGETNIIATFAPNETAVNPYTATGTYGSTSFESTAPSGNSGTTVTVATMNATGVASETFTYSNIVYPTGWPGGVTVSWGGGTSADGGATFTGGNGTITLSGKPQDITVAAGLTVTFKAKSSNGGPAVDGSFKLVVNPHEVTPTVGYASGKNKDNTYVGDAIATSAALTVPSSPYFVGVGTTGADAQGWINLATADIGTKLTLAWTNKDASGSSVLTGVTTELRGTVTYTGATTGTVSALDRVWDHPYGEGPLQATQTVSVTVQVRLNGSETNATLRDGQAVKLTRTSPASPAFTTTSTIQSTNHASTAMLVPTGTYTIEVGGDKRSVAINSETTINFDYYDVNYATLAAATDHLLYGSSTTATKGLVLVDAATGSATTTTVTLPSVTGQGNYTLDRWTQNKPTDSAGTFSAATTNGSNWSITTGYHTDLTGETPAGITLKPTAKTTGIDTTVTVRVDNKTDTAGKAGVTKIELWGDGATAATYTANVTDGVASFGNITAGTYDIYVSNGTTAIDSNVDITFNTTTKAAYVDYYTVNFTSPATQVHFQNNAKWDKLGGAKAVTAKVGGTTAAGLSHAVGAAIATGTPVLKGTVVAFKVDDWTADYTLAWNKTLSGVDAKNNNGTLTASSASVFPASSPVAATLTQQTHTISGTTERTDNTGKYSDVKDVKYTAKGVTGGDLAVSYNTTTGAFSLAVPAGFTYTLSAQSKDLDSTQITGYKVGGTAADPADFTVSATDADNKALTIVIVGSVFKFKLTHGDTTIDDTTGVVTGKTWPDEVFGYAQPAAQTVTIVNTGNRPLTNVAISPLPGSGFTAGNLSANTIQVGGTATFTVQPVAGLSVNGGTAHTQRYTVSADHAPSKTYDVSLTVTPAELDYATVAIDRPVENVAPATTATASDEYASYYSVSKVDWSVVGGGTMPDKFQEGGQYQVELTLTPDGDHIFVDESKNHPDPYPDPSKVFYTVNGASHGNTGTDGGTLITRTVNDDHTVTLVYQFKPLAAGLPAPTMVPLTYEKGKLTQITATSSDPVNFYYVILPAGETAPTAQAIYDAAKGTTPISNQIVAGEGPSGNADANRKVTWNAGKEFDGTPGSTYTVYVVAQPKNGGALSEVNKTSVTLPKKLTITIKKAGATPATTVKGTDYPTVDSTTGKDITTNVTLDKDHLTTDPALSMRAAHTFVSSLKTVTEDLVNGNIGQAWALKQVDIRRGATDEAATNATGGDRETRTTDQIKYGWAAPVTQIDVTFRQRIVHKPVISGSPTIGSTLTAGVGTGASQVTIGDTKVTAFGDSSNFKDHLKYQWQWNNGGTWTDIPEATGHTWKVPAEHSGHSFRIKVTYTGDPGYSGSNSVVTSDPTTTKDQKLEKPVLQLLKVENSADNAATMIVDTKDLDLGGLYLLVAPVDNENLAEATYKVSLKRGTTAIAGDAFNVTIDPRNQDPAKWAEVTVDGEKRYAIRWPANWDNVRPGDSGAADHKFTATVQAAVPAGKTGWISSDPNTAQSTAGRRPLHPTDLTGEFTDRIFNGAAQTGYGTTGATTTSDPVNGQIKTIDTLFQRDGGTQKGTAVGTIHIQYADKPDKTAIADTKTHVNMTEAAGEWRPAPTGKHDYYTYVNVDQGGLYLALSQFAFNLTDPTQDKDWQITQAPTQIKGLQNKTTEQNVAVDLSTSNPRVRYQAANKSWVGTYPGQTGAEYVTSQFDFTYAVTGWSSGTPVAGTNYTLAADGKTFTPISTGTFTITVTAKYKDSTAAQFKADLAEPPTATFTVGGQMGDFTGLQVETTRREATYGDKDSAVSDPTTTAVWYVTTDVNGDPDANAAKYFSLEGITVTETWSNGNQTYDLSTLEPENLVGVSGGKAEKVDGKLKVKFDNAGGSQRTITFKVTNTHPAKNGAGGTGNVTQTSTNTVTLILKARPLPYEVNATYSISNDTNVIDWTKKAEKLWDNSTNLDTGDKARDGTPLRLRTVVTDPYAIADNVTIDPNPGAGSDYKSSSKDVGKDRIVSAVSPQPAGDRRLFYKTGTPTNDEIDIYPAHVNYLNIAIAAPDTKNNSTISGRRASVTTLRDELNNSGWGMQPGNNNLPITWYIWNGTINDWEPVGSNTLMNVSKTNFAIDQIYKAEVTVRADTNHYLSDVKTPYVYTVNGKLHGDPSFEDYDEWANREESKVSVTVDKTKPFHNDWKPAQNVLYNNEATVSIVFHTFETPQLQFGDQKGTMDLENPGIAKDPGSDHETPNSYVHHTETVTAGEVSGDIVYTITVNAKTKDIYGVRVIRTSTGKSDDLLAEGRATLAAVQKGTESADGTVTAIRSAKRIETTGDPIPSTMFMIDREGKTPADLPDGREYDPKKDLIIYTLTIPNSLTQNEGIYHMELQAMGSSTENNYDTSNVNVAKCYYTFTLNVLPKREPIEVPGGGGTTVIEDYNVSYWLSNVGTSADPIGEHVAPNKTPQNVPTVTALNGYTFLGWSLDNPAKVAEPKLVDPKTVKITEDTTFYAIYKAPAYDHSHYVIGFPDGTFGPDNNITRGQVATIIARACLEDFREGAKYGNPGGYSDVDEHWASSAIAYCSINNVFNGYEDGTFRPDDAISRQELATAVARLGEIQPSAGMPFTDSADVAAWAQDTVYTAYANGWIQGYEDGTFLPENDIKRSETVKIFNGYLERTVNQEGLSDLHEYVHSGVASNIQSGDKAYMTWPDVPETHWAYYEIIEAANDHNYHRSDESDPKSTEMWETAKIDEIWRYHDDLEDGASRVDDLMSGDRLSAAEIEAQAKAEEEAKAKAEAEAKAAEEAAKAEAENQPTDQPIEETTPPVEETTPPVEETTPPVEETTPPVEETTLPVEETTPPVEETTPPVEETTPPVEETTPPVEETTPPVEETTPPVEETTPPVEETTPPTEETNPSETMIHRAYINGFEDSTFRPDDAITRAAVASVIARTLLEGYDPDLIYDTELVDLDGHWAKNYVAFCEQSGVFGGYEDNTFRPDQGISRQEFAVVLARLSELTGEGELTFTDSADVADWAASGVTAAVDKGWLKGYEDGTFLPEKLITRAEAVKLFNGFLGRGVNYNGLSGVTGGSIWSDVSPTHWAYLEIVEAANDHTFHWNDADDPTPPERWETAGEI